MRPVGKAILYCNPTMNIVGLPDAAVQEAKERVRAAIRNSGAIFPMKRITVNLAPADLKKEGPAYDLPIAVGILLASEQVFTDASTTVLLGELSLDGTLQLTHGILPMVALARDKGVSTVIVPAVNAREAALVEGTDVIPVNSLGDLVAHLRGEVTIPPFRGDGVVQPADVALFGLTDMAEIRGQEHVKRALEVAASGGHNVLTLSAGYRPGLAVHALRI